MRALALAALAVVPVGCASAPMPSPEADQDALVARIDQFHRSIREGDKAGYADVFVDDFVFSWSRNGQVYDREMILLTRMSHQHAASDPSRAPHLPRRRGSTTRPGVRSPLRHEI